MSKNQKMIMYAVVVAVLAVGVYYLGKHMNWWGEEQYALLGPSAKEYTNFLAGRLNTILYSFEKKVTSDANKMALLYLSAIVNGLENNNYAGIRKAIDNFNELNNIGVKLAKEYKYEDDIKEAGETIKSGKLPMWAKI